MLAWDILATSCPFKSSMLGDGLRTLKRGFWWIILKVLDGAIFFMSAASQISFAVTGLAAHANHLFYRFRTVFRVPYVMRPWYESRVRSVSPSDVLLGSVLAYDLRAR